MFKVMSMIVAVSACLINSSFLEASHEKKSVKHMERSGENTERKFLEQNCRLIIAQINEYFASIGAIDSSARNQAVCREVTRYLTSVGTPTAFGLLREYEQLGWSNVR